MAQMVTRIADSLLEEVDELVESGIVDSRSDAVRTALRDLIDHHRRRREGEAIVAAYTRMPQTDEELVGLDEMTRLAIEEEPW